MKRLLALAAFAVTGLAAHVASAASANWGYLANPHFTSKDSRFPAPAVSGVYFFPGEGKCTGIVGENQILPFGQGVTALCDPYAYGTYSGPNSTLFTFLPIDQNTNLLWHSNPNSQVTTVNQMIATGANTIVMSYWAENWETYAPMQDSPAADDELFNAVKLTGTGQNQKVTIMPALDGIDFALRVPAYGSSWDYSNPVVIALRYLVTHYITSPQDTSWPSLVTQLYDSSGQSRYAFMIVNAAAIINMTGTQFAAQLDALARTVESGLNVSIGFTIDPSAPDCTHDSCYNGGYAPAPYSSVIPPIFTFGATSTDPGNPPNTPSSFLALQGFYRDRFSPDNKQGNPTYDQTRGVCGTTPEVPTAAGREAWKRADLQSWISTGIPVFADVSTGYDGRIVFPTNGSIGDTSDEYDDGYRNAVAQLKGMGNRGITFDSWNGYTEGTVGVSSYRVTTDSSLIACTPTDQPPQSVQQSSVVSTPGADGVQNRWLSDLLVGDPRDCDTQYYVNEGAVKYHVFGAICDRWQAVGGSAGFGAPTSSQAPTTYGGGQYNQFLNNSKAIVWSPSYGAWDLYGAIYAKYYGAGMDAFGLPNSSENDSPGHGNTGGRYVQFNGNASAIFWGSPGAFEIYGLIYQTYKNMGSDGSYLGLPTTDELAGSPSGACSAAGRSYNRFQGGYIEYCPTPIYWPWLYACAYGSICAHH